MARGKITADTVNALQAGASAHFLWDDKLAGFGVKVTPKGAKVYILQYRMGGRSSKVRRYTIGNERPWRPQSARTEAERLLRLVGQGVDVAATAKDDAAKAELERVNATELAFSAYVEAFASTRLKAKWPKSWGQTLGCLKLHASKHLADKPLPNVTKADIRKLLARLDEQPGTRRNLWSALSYLFNHAVSEDLIATSPLAGLQAPSMVLERDHYLSGDELRWMWSATNDLASPYSSIVRLLALLGQRRSEVGELPWDELSRSVGEWSLPAARAKNGEASTIPLPAAAIAEFDALAGGEKWPRHGLVFKSREGTAVSGFSKAKRRLDDLMATAAAKEDAKVRPWRVHDLRRTLATNLQRLGVDFAVVEHLLNHKEKTRAGIAKVYQRHGYLAEKRAALEQWEAELGRIVGGGSPVVIPLRRPA